jgi:hypothetical protein
MSNHYGKQKFKSALTDLVAAGGIHSRVSSALGQHLLHIKEEEDLPESVRKEFAQFRASFDIAATPGSHVSDLINNMSDTEAEKVAQHIVDLYEKVVAAYWLSIDLNQEPFLQQFKNSGFILPRRKRQSHLTFAG